MSEGDEETSVQQCPAVSKRARNRAKRLSCEELWKQIDELVNRNKRDFGGSGTHGLKWRWEEQVNGENGPGTDIWDSHNQKYEETQRTLDTYLKEYQNRCPGPPPPNVLEWVEKKAPAPEDHKKKVPEGAKTAVVGLGLAYVVYRVIRFLPSLFPPLWETIPVNLAVP